jgi:hypothetical protein
MCCEDIAQQLSDYLDGALDQGAASTLEKHLSTCEACRDELEAVRQTIALLNDIDEVAPPADLLDRVHAQIEQEDAHATKHIIATNIFNRPAMRLAIAASILALLGVHVLHDTEPTPVSTGTVDRKRVADKLDRVETKEQQAAESMMDEEIAIAEEAEMEQLADTKDRMLAGRGVVADIEVLPQPAAESKKEAPQPAPATRLVAAPAPIRAELDGSIWGGPADAIVEAGRSEPADRRHREMKRSIALPRARSAKPPAAPIVAETVVRKQGEEREGAPAREEITVHTADPTDILNPIRQLKLSHRQLATSAGKFKSGASEVADNKTDGRLRYQIEVPAAKYAALMKRLQPFRGPSALGKMHDADDAITDPPAVAQTVTLIIIVVQP